MSTSTKKGKILSAQTRAIVFSVLQFALREKKAKCPLLDINKAMDRVAAMTGLCRDTLSKIKKEGATNGGVWEMRVKKKRQKVITNPNDVDKINIINKIEEFEKRNEAVSLRKLLKELKHDNNFCGGKTSLLIVLNSMGYKWEKNESNKKVLRKVPGVSEPCNSKPKSTAVHNLNDISTQPSNIESTVLSHQTFQVQKSPVSEATCTQEVPGSSLHPPLPPTSATFMPRPLLLHAPHYVFNHLSRNIEL